MTHAVQISAKLNDGTILVVGAEGPDELGIHLKALGLDSEVVLARFSALEGLDPVGVAQAGLGATVIPQQAGPQQQGVIAEPPGVVKTCNHGARKWVSGISKKTGKPYGMWACNTAQGAPDKCEPEFYRAT